MADQKHLKWLVERRSENQELALRLHVLLKEKSSAIAKDKDLANLGQVLIAIVFSLWRAVFLGDVKGSLEGILSHGETYLEHLILHNQIGYVQDTANNKWTFVYYVNNARQRLQLLGEKTDVVKFSKDDVTNSHTESPRVWWDHHHHLLKRAIDDFEDALEQAATPSTTLR